MHDFVYVSKKEATPLKEELKKIIHQVQNEVRRNFTFRYDFIGSSSRNMITYDRKSNVGFDFDVNIEPNDPDENYTPKEIRTIIRTALDKYSKKYGYSFAEDSTSVITIKVVDKKHKKIKYSCDFAIVYNCEDGNQQYIRYNKSNKSYTWEYRGQGYEHLSDRIDWLKKHGLWENLKDYYIYKKNINNNPDKHSRAIFAEAVNEMCKKNNCRI